ncbi:MAG: HAD hydrolase-like protein [Oscillospiraceae bacterium]|nr:HAD hydrolase-like protein [Oscillospiraceae bacterium]
MTWNTVLFDLDGTLTNSGPGIFNAVEYAVSKLGLEPHERDFYRGFIGPPLPWSFENLLGLPPEEAARAVEIFREYYNDRGIWENSPYEGIPEMLAQLRGSGKTLMVAASKPQKQAEQVLAKVGLAQYMDYISAADPTDSRDQKAAAIARCRERAAGPAVMVGDRRHDIQGAKANAIPAVGVLYGYGARDELEAAGADYIAETVEQLKNLLIKGDAQA